MQIEAEDELTSAIDHIQRAAEQLKQQRSMEAKFWQKRIQELSEQNEMMQNQIADLQAENRQLKADLQSQSAEIESLRALQQSLTRTLQSKEQEITRYINFNQNLKGLIEQQPMDLPMQMPSSIDHSYLNSPSFDTPKYGTTTSNNNSPTRNYQSPAYRSNVRTNISPNPSAQSPNSTTSVSKSTQFIQAAKEELTYSDFNQMINEIKLYNRHNQTREKTIDNVRQLLCPAHRGLFDQFLPMISGI